MRTLALSFVIALASTGLLACAESHPQGAVTLPAGARAPGTAQVGDTSVCPVSGEAFTVTADSPRAEFEGKTYYFCCGGCAQKFAADPKKFLARLPPAS
jgi:YHS domain-containing protein